MSSSIKRALFNISSLADLGQEITAGSNFQARIQSALHMIMGTFLTSRGALYSFSSSSSQIEMLTQKGFPHEHISWLAADDIVALPKHEPLFAEAGSRLAGSGVAIVMPLWVREQFTGAIMLGTKFTADPYTEEDVELLRVIASQIAVSLNNHALFNDLSAQLAENRKLYEEMRRIYHDTLQAFAAAIDAKDPYTKHHSQRVAKYSVAIARELGWNEHEIEGMYVAGYLHDVGKLVISNELLNKKSPFTVEELDEIKKHSMLSYKILSQIRFPWKDVQNMIRHHHERLDGGGYPDALTQDDLSEGVRILSLADSFDAMTSKRAYRDKMDMTTALNELRKCLNTQFDNKIMLAFCKVLDKEIRGELTEPDILPHFGPDSDLTIISTLLEGLIDELSVSPHP